MDRFIFTCAQREGALLVLPDGATRIDLELRNVLFEYAREHVPRWYKWLVGERGLDARNGSLYLITGADKTSNWCLASYSNTSGEARSLLRFANIGTAPVGWTGRYSWESSSSVEARTCPALREGSSTNQCVFVRGYRLTLREGLYQRMFAERAELCDIVSSRPDRILGNILGARTPARWLSWLFSRSHRSSPTEPAESNASKTDSLVEDIPNVSAVSFGTLYANRGSTFVNSHTILQPLSTDSS
jgi:hypothetical protein